MIMYPHSSVYKKLIHLWLGNFDCQIMRYISATIKMENSIKAKRNIHIDERVCDSAMHKSFATMFSSGPGNSDFYHGKGRVQAKHCRDFFVKPCENPCTNCDR